MVKAITANADIVSGEFSLTFPDKWRTAVKTLEDGAYLVTVDRMTGNRRSDLQNRYYHGVVLPMLAEAMGEVDSVAHEILKQELLGKSKIIETPDGEIHEVWYSPSTKGLDVSSFYRYTEACRKLGAEWFQINIPPPSTFAN